MIDTLAFGLLFFSLAFGFLDSCFFFGLLFFCGLLFYSQSSISLAVTQKIERGVTIRNHNSTPRYLPKKNENLCPHKTCAGMFASAQFLRAEKSK